MVAEMPTIPTLLSAETAVSCDDAGQSAEPHLGGEKKKTYECRREEHEALKESDRQPAAPRQSHTHRAAWTMPAS